MAATQALRLIQRSRPVNAVLRTSQSSERMRLRQHAKHPAFARRCCLSIEGEERYENGLERGSFGYRFGHWRRQRRGRVRPGLPQHLQRRVRRRRLGQCARTERMSCGGPSPASVWWRVCLAATHASVLPGLTRSRRRTRPADERYPVIRDGPGKPRAAPRIASQ
jgi:hypothetical protein